ncbi:hypothetical protein OAG85_01475 [Verrucomicrobiales bacterium]|nr:hypothetical protein [Verrucomicrobiales bacterium]
MNRLLNVTLVLSLIANVILALTGSPAKATQPGTQPVRVHEKWIIPQARVLLKTNDRSDEDVRQQPAVVIPWVLAKEGGLRHHGYDFGIPDALIRGLELGPAEQRAIDRAVLKMNQVLREIEERGIQPSEDSMVIVEIDEKQQQAALENFVAEIEQALPEAKAAMLSESAVACNYLRGACLQLKADEPRGVRFSLGGGLPEGGHLQGVQAIVQGNYSKLLLSGSSNDFSYILTVPMSARGDAKGILTKLLPLPCRHAGGFQLVEGRYAAIGLEDNRLKDTSKVWVVDVAAKDFGEPVKPVISIERHGQVERATAGAIAMAGLGKRHLLVVGTWDSATLDFYESNEYPLEDVRCRFEKAGTWSATDADRRNWSDATYGSYQNVNLIVDAQGRCFLAGFCRRGMWITWICTNGNGQKAPRYRSN